jgi:response regulator RpfG family c-di-GMP phosphodiesterase
MTQEQIKKILSDYKILKHRTVELVNILHESKLDNTKFPFGLTSVEDADSFEYVEDEDMVYVSYSYGVWGGDTEYVSCSFPMKYFSQSNKEILDDVCYKRDKEIERKRMEKEEKVKKEKADKEVKEREQYEKLKEKFEFNENNGGNE